MSGDLLNQLPTTDEDEQPTTMLPTLEQAPEMNPNLEGVPLAFRDGMGAQNIKAKEDAAQVSLKQVWKDGLNQSVVNSAVELFEDIPAAVDELFKTGLANLEEHREELTEGIPLHLHDNIMSSRTLVGARARKARQLEDMQVQGRMAQQVGISRGAMALAAGLIDADLPLMFASGGTLAAARTAGATARGARAIGASVGGARTAGDISVGVTGGALSGGIVGGGGNLVRDDYDINTMFQMVVAGAAMGGTLNPVVGRVMPDRYMWQQAADLEVQRAMQRTERDIFRQVDDPYTPLHDNSMPIDDALDAAPRIEQAKAAEQASADRVEMTPGEKAFGLFDKQRARTIDGRSVGAAQLRPAQVAINNDTLDLAGAGAPQGIIDTSVRNQQWRQDTAFRERMEEDTANPAVRMLVGGSDFKIKLPFSNKELPVGQALGSILTLAQRDFTALVFSNSPSANFVASEILESASGLGRRGTTSAVLREMFQSSAMVHSAKGIRDFRGSYYRSRGLNPLNLASSRQFSADLRLQMQRRQHGRGEDPEFTDIIDQIDRTHKEVLGHMKGPDEARSVRGAREIDDEPGYFRYAWEPERFRSFMRTSEGERSLIEAFKRGYMARGMEDDIAASIADAIVRRFRDKAVGVGAADGRRLDMDSRAGIEEVLQASNLSRPEIDRIMKRLNANTQERTKKGYMKHRVEADLETKIPGTEHRLVDLMSDDFERTLHQYVGDASGSAALAHKGVRDQADMNNLIDTIMYEQAALGDSSITRPQLEAIFSQFAGTAHKGHIWGSQTTGVSPLTSVLTKATRASLLQRTGLTQVMDTANLFVGNGVARAMEPVMSRLGWNKKGTKTKAEFQAMHDELQSIGVIAGKDHDIFAPHLSIDETALANQFLMNATQRGMATIERATHFMSGQVHVTKAQQNVAVSAIATNVMRTLAGHKTNLTPRMLRDLGLESESIQELTDLIETGVITVQGGKVELNTAQWSPELRLEFGASVVRGVNQQVQKGVIGETSVWMNSDIGKLLSSLKTFSLVATQKQMARNLMIGGGSHYITASAWQLGFAYAVLSLAQTMQGTNMDPADRGWLAAAYTPNIGTVPMLLDPMTSMLGFDDLNFSPYGRYASYLDTPVFETVEKLARAPGSIKKMLSGEGSYNDMQNARAMFFMNWFGMKQVWESM